MARRVDRTAGPERAGASRSDPVAVIDIGSNSGRVVVFQRDVTGHLRLLAGSRAALRLVQGVDTGGQLTEATMAHTMEALRDFQAIATSAGATRIIAVATAAMRDASNGALFAERVHRGLGFRIQIIGGSSVGCSIVPRSLSRSPTRSTPGAPAAAVSRSSARSAVT
jgi:hypothetical protein